MNKITQDWRSSDGYVKRGGGGIVVPSQMWLVCTCGWEQKVGGPGEIARYTGMRHEMWHLYERLELLEKAAGLWIDPA